MRSSVAAIHELALTGARHDHRDRRRCRSADIASECGDLMGRVQVEFAVARRAETRRAYMAARRALSDGEAARRRQILLRDDAIGAAAGERRGERRQRGADDRKRGAIRSTADELRRSRLNRLAISHHSFCAQSWMKPKRPFQFCTAWGLDRCRIELVDAAEQPGLRIAWRRRSRRPGERLRTERPARAIYGVTTIISSVSCR